MSNEVKSTESARVEGEWILCDFLELLDFFWILYIEDF
jgi:hypothetical protein